MNAGRNQWWTDTAECGNYSPINDTIQNQDYNICSWHLLVNTIFTKEMNVIYQLSINTAQNAKKPTNWYNKGNEIKYTTVRAVLHQWI